MVIGTITREADLCAGDKNTLYTKESKEGSANDKIL